MAITRAFPFLELDRKDGFKPEYFTKGVNLPKKSCPAQFFVKTKEYLCGGYFVCYNQTLSQEAIIQACQKRNWQFLANLIGDFFVIYCDFVRKELFVFTGQSSAFPCYFSLSKDRLVLSPEFGFVCRRIKRKTLDIGSALDFIYGQHVGQRTPETFISEIKQIPPGSLLKINKDFSYSLENLIDFEGFYSQEMPPYKSVELFVNDLLSLLAVVINEQLTAVGKQSFAAELSSGFDSSLICYLLKKESERPFICYSSVAPSREDADPQNIIQEFSQKHNLKTVFLDVTNFYPFSLNHDLLWTKRYFFPADHGQEEVYKTWARYRKDGARAIFTGFGGDEIYRVWQEARIAQFAVHFEFFHLVRSFKEGNGRILTPKGTKLLLSRERFARKNFYLSVIPTSSAAPALFYFPMFWKLGLWQLSPFIDPRVVKLALRMPRKDRKGISRQDLFHHRQDIFVPSQFRPKRGGTSWVAQFLTKRKELVFSILNESILGQKGWIRSLEIIKDIRNDNIQYYRENGDLPGKLHDLLRLEYFLKYNKVKI